VLPDCQLRQSEMAAFISCSILRMVSFRLN
jgi:hypothetical protein